MKLIFSIDHIIVKDNIHHTSKMFHSKYHLICLKFYKYILPIHVCDRPHKEMTLDRFLVVSIETSTSHCVPRGHHSYC